MQKRARTSTSPPPPPPPLNHTNSSPTPSIILVAASMYPDLTDARFILAVEFLHELKKQCLDIVICDDSPPSTREQVRHAFLEAGGSHVEMTYFPPGTSGKKGKSVRQAVRGAVAKHARESSSGAQQQRWAIVFTELEKVHFLRFVRHVVTPIIDNQCEVVFPKRDENLFRATYAIEQYHMEMFGIFHLNQLFRRATGQVQEEFYDFLFGPIAWEGATISPFYLKYTGELWDAQMVPAVHALQQIGARWMSVTIPYRHHALQRAQEEGSPELCEKRVLQYRLLMDTLGRSLVNPLPSPAPSPSPMKLLPSSTLGSSTRIGTVVIVGSNGNIGSKITQYLVHASPSHRPSRLILIDKVLPTTEEARTEFLSTCAPGFTSVDDFSMLDVSKIEWIEADVSKYEYAWASKFENAHVVFLLAAKNPFPEATSKDAYESMRITSNLLEACAAGRVSTVVYFSSNHVVGQLRNSSDHDPIDPNATPNFGTTFVTHGATMDSTRYASAKVAGEAQCEAMASSGRLPRIIVLRVGWCQPGDNVTETMTLTGTPTMQPVHNNKDDDGLGNFENPDAILKWFKNMHLKNSDLYLLVDACCAYAGDESFIRVNAVSNNTPMSRWVVGNDTLGYVPGRMET